MTNSEQEEESMPPLDDSSDVELEFPVEGEALVTRRVLSAQEKKDDIEQQREIFSILTTILIIKFVV